jgi:hypothetical protein
VQPIEPGPTVICWLAVVNGAVGWRGRIFATGVVSRCEDAAATPVAVEPRKIFHRAS